MALCFPYRYLVAAMTCVGLFIVQCIRASFVLIVTHTSKSATSNLNEVTIYPGCTVFNTSRDYESPYSQDVGMLFHTVYFCTLCMGTLLGGYLSHRFAANRVIGVATLSSCLLSLALPQVFKVSSIGVFIIRAGQGLAEGIAQSPISSLIGSWALKHDSSRLLCISFLGFWLSPAVAMILTGACLCYISWDSSLYLLGGAGVLWNIAWSWLVYPHPQECPYVSKTELMLHATEGEHLTKGSVALAARIPWKKILTSKAVWAIWMGCVCKNFVNSTVVTLQPQFFKDIFGIRTADIGLLLSLPFFLAAASMYVFSYTADRLITSKRLSVTAVRKLMQCVGSLVESVFFVCMIYGSSWQMSFAFLTLAYTIGGMTFAGYSCCILDLSPQFSSAVSSVVFTGTLAGAASTFIASLVPGRNSTVANWAVIFWLEAAVAGCSALVFFLFASGEKQAWDDVKGELTSTEDHKEDNGQYLLDPGQVNKNNTKSYTGAGTFGKIEKQDIHVYP